MASHLLLLLLSLLALTTTTHSAPPRPSSFITKTCQVTRYPAICIQSLALYSGKIKRNNKRIAQVALTVSLSQARFANEYVIRMSKSKGLKGREYKVMRDCVSNMGDTVDRLGDSLVELKLLRGRSRKDNFEWRVSNMQTWVSAALTNEATCIDGFAGRDMDGKLKTAVRARISGVARITSNALALVNRFAETR